LLSAIYLRGSVGAIQIVLDRTSRYIHLFHYLAIRTARRRKVDYGYLVGW